MNLLHDAYAISSAAVAAIAASIALEQFPWHATVPLFQGYLLHITNRFIANDHEARLCKVFEERLRDLWRRPPSSCVVMKRWVFRAERNQLLAMVTPPAVKGATTPMTPSSGKRCNKKTSVAPAPLGADKASPPPPQNVLITSQLPRRNRVVPAPIRVARRQCPGIGNDVCFVLYGNRGGERSPNMVAHRNCGERPEV